MLNALAAFLPPDDRLVLIEDTAELQLERDEPGSVRGAPRAGRRAGGDAFATCCERPCDTGRIGSCWARCAAAKRSTCCRPSTPGHSGTLVDHSRELRRAGVDPVRVLCAAVRRSTCPIRRSDSAIAEGLQLLVHLDRRQGQRVVRQIVRVRRYDAATDTYALEEAS